jgi:hypothetical protein
MTQRYIGTRQSFTGLHGSRVVGMIYDTTKPRQATADNPAARYAFVKSVEISELEAELARLNASVE